ncbi:hypothetical protein [Sphingomonas sp. MS122]|uniref:hypothetical protein n=1 Tax=Sphingomonas sp. MS122 TaxID=3412683 RepID=UPI003C2C9E1D
MGGDVLMSVGADRFVWNGGGVVHGTVDLGGDNDSAQLTNLTDANLGRSPRITGGEGTDALAFSNVTTGNVARFDGWERIDATNDTELMFNGFLTLGDAGTGTGVFALDASSTIFGGGANGGIAAFTAGQRATLINAGRIDLTNGSGAPGDSFSIRGNYVGNGGLLMLNTVLGNDSSASDRLVIDGGSATGTTSVTIVNAGAARAARAAAASGPAAAAAAAAAARADTGRSRPGRSGAAGDGDRPGAAADARGAAGPAACAAACAAARAARAAGGSRAGALARPGGRGRAADAGRHAGDRGGRAALCRRGADRASPRRSHARHLP